MTRGGGGGGGGGLDFLIGQANHQGNRANLPFKTIIINDDMLILFGAMAELLQ